MIYNDKINVAYITSYSDCIAKYDAGGFCLGGR